MLFLEFEGNAKIFQLETHTGKTIQKTKTLFFSVAHCLVRDSNEIVQSEMSPLPGESYALICLFRLNTRVV